mgnify:CR=1 FL=1
MRYEAGRIIHEIRNKKAIEIYLKEIKRPSNYEDAESLSKTIATLYKLLFLPIVIGLATAFSAALLYLFARIFV